MGIFRYFYIEAASQAIVCRIKHDYSINPDYSDCETIPNTSTGGEKKTIKNTKHGAPKVHWGFLNTLRTQERPTHALPRSLTPQHLPRMGSALPGTSRYLWGTREGTSKLLTHRGDLPCWMDRAPQRTERLLLGKARSVQQRNAVPLNTATGCCFQG